MKSWYVVQTRAGLERAVSRAIKTDTIDVFLPTYLRVHYQGGRREEIIRPLFPLYLFAYFDTDQEAQCDWGRILRAVGVQTILGIRRNTATMVATRAKERPAHNGSFVGDRRPVPVPEQVITVLKRKVEAGGGHVKLNEAPPPAPLPRLHPDQPVRVIAGAFDGFQGLVDQDKKTRVWVLLDILGKQRRTLVDREAVEPVESHAACGPVHPFNGPLHPFQ